MYEISRLLRLTLSATQEPAVPTSVLPHFDRSTALVFSCGITINGAATSNNEVGLLVKQLAYPSECDVEEVRGQGANI